MAEQQAKLDKDDATPHDAYLQIVAREASGYPKDGCMSCGGAVRMGFFFDAFGRNRDIDSKESSQYSNICRLWEAHRNNRDRGMRAPVRKNQFWYRFYYSGLGTALNDDAASETWKKVGGAALTLGGKKALEGAGSVTRVNTALEQLNVKEQGKKALKEAATEFSIRPIIRAYDDFKKSVANAPRTAARVMNVLSASPERIWERTKAGGIALWRKEKAELKGNPLKAGWSIVRQLFVGIVAENVPVVRDWGPMSFYFGSGVTTRVDAALKQFEEAVDDARAQIRDIKRIEVSVFGADRGCVLARAFVNKMASKYKGKNDKQLLRLDGIAVEIKFLGLLDAVSSIMSEDSGTLIGMVPFLGLIKADYKDQTLTIPACVQRCVHFAAAHEMRFYQRLDSLEKTRGEQVLYPGTSSDVVGGAPTGSLGFHAELMRVPLRDMLLEAVKAGAAMDTMEDLSKYKPDTFTKFSLSMPIPYEGKQYRIKSLVDAYRSLVPRTNGLDFVAHSSVFMRWIAVRYQDPRFRGAVTDPMTDWKRQREEADVQRKAAKVALDLEIQRQGVNMSMLSSRSLADRARLRQLKAESEAAQRRYEALIVSAPRQDYTTVWQRLDQEASEMVSRWEKFKPEHEARRTHQFPRPINAGPSYTPIIMAPALAQPADDLTEDQIKLVKAWQQGADGKNPLPEPVMTLFDVLVHDTLLTSWHDHILAPTLYFRTRDKDIMGVTDYEAEDKQRRKDDARAPDDAKRNKHWDERFGQPSRAR